MHPYPILISPYEIPVVLFGLYPARALKCIYLCTDERSAFVPQNSYMNVERPTKIRCTRQCVHRDSSFPPSHTFSNVKQLSALITHYFPTPPFDDLMLILLPPYSPTHPHLTRTLDSVSWMQLDSMLLNFHSVRFSFGAIFDGF